MSDLIRRETVIDMVIKALRSAANALETMDDVPALDGDLISRADALKAICGDCTIERKNLCEKDGGCYELKALKALPSAEAVQGWIPCSERLPDTDDDMLVTDECGTVRMMWYRNGYWYTAEESIMHKPHSILAWMPLPTPYKGGEDE